MLEQRAGFGRVLKNRSPLASSMLLPEIRISSENPHNLFRRRWKPQNLVFS